MSRTRADEPRTRPAAAPGEAPGRLGNREILLFWVPLAATWLMMAAEGPFLSAVIARLPDPKFNLAAWGVAFAFAVLVEAPVIMLMSAATALVEDATSYRRLRNFANGLNAGATVLLLVVLVPPVYRLLAGTLLGLPDRVAELTYGALWFFLPWPAAIGYRRFVQGVLIRSGRTRLVALGTVLRLVGMTAAGLALALATGLPGAWVGAAALAVGVCVEAGAARWMARGVVGRLLAGGEIEGDEGETEAARRAPPARTGASLEYGHILRFYYPLALTSFLGLTVQPMLTFFMGRAPAPVESLAVFPVVHALSFIFRALGLSYQDAAIALLGPRRERFPELFRFAGWMGIASSAVLGAIVFTPLASVWFVTISGLTPDLAAFALTPARILLPIPALAVFFSLQRAILMQARWTQPITLATAVEVVCVALLFPAFAWGAGWVGATAAFAAFLGGRTASNLYLLPRSRRVIRSEEEAGGAGPDGPTGPEGPGEPGSPGAAG